MEPTFCLVQADCLFGWLSNEFIFHENCFWLKMLFFFAGAGEEERVGGGCVAVGDGGDDVGAAEPVGFGQIGCGPLRGVVGVGVVEAGDAQAQLAGVALDFDELKGSDLIAVVSGVSADVAGGDGGVDLPALGLCMAEERAAALVGVGLLAVGADLLIN